ncbi:MAG: hypothetical protein ACKVOO_07905 [Burkholderiaceae bacterium]
MKSPAAAVTAAELRGRFAVYGRYYEAELGDCIQGNTAQAKAAPSGLRHALRSHLEIVDHTLPWPAVRQQAADWVVVMMNPGASRPLQAPDAQGWAPALPDRTQYQLMKLALRCSPQRAIGHIRVINLSDLRTPQSARLFELLALLPDDRHSIFSAARAGELARALGAPQVPVLCAWGMAKPLAPLANAALAALGGRTLWGLHCGGMQYRHPLPQRSDLQQHWLDDMQAQIERLSPAVTPEI